MSLSSHIDILHRSINFHIKNLWRIRRFIDENTCHHAVRALITSRIDYWNALFSVLLSKDITRMQRLKNRAARLIFCVGRRVEAAPLVESLHWLKINERISFKTLLLVYKNINNLAPDYLSEMFTFYKPGRYLRSSFDTTNIPLHKALRPEGGSEV